MGKIDPQRSPWLCRILRAGSGESVGSGFLIGHQNVLTCAHVVTEAVSAPSSEAQPTEDVVVQFPTLEGQPHVQAFVLPGGWVPPNAGQGDVALLGLRTVPMCAAQAPISVSKTTLNHRYRAYGFPRDEPIAVECHGSIRGYVTHDWIGLETAPGSARIEPGFSGAAVWDDDLNAVAGMVVADLPGLASAPGDPWPAYMLSMPTLWELSRAVPAPSGGTYMTGVADGTRIAKIRCTSFDGHALSREVARWLETQNMAVIVQGTGSGDWTLRARRRLARRVPIDTLVMNISYTDGVVIIEASTGLTAATKTELGPLSTPLLLGTATAGLRALRRGGASAGRLGLLAGVAAAAGAAAVTSMSRQDLLYRCVTVAEYYAFSPEVGSGQEPASSEP